MPAITGQILLAEPAESIRTWMELALGDTLTAAVQVVDGDALRQSLLSGGSVDVVIANARIPAPSALQVLAQARAIGVHVPFIVVRGFHGRGLHVFVGETDGSRLVSRVVSPDDFRATVSQLMNEAQRLRAA